MNLGMNRGLLAAAAAMALTSHTAMDGAAAFAAFNRGADPVQPNFPGGFHTGHTQGSSRDVEHERQRNRLARKARRTERLHRHTATGRKRLSKESDPFQHWSAWFDVHRGQHWDFIFDDQYDRATMIMEVGRRQYRNEMRLKSA